MARPAQQLHAVQSAAADAQRSLESRVTGVHGVWRDSARRSFEAEHLAAIRADARHLRDELGEIARLANIATRQLRLDR